MKPSAELLDGLQARFDYAVIAFVGTDGYPLGVATDFRVASDRGVVVLDGVAGDDVQPPEGEQVNVVFSHIRPQPGVGYDERRYVSIWGRAEAGERGVALTPERAWGWDETEMPFFEYSERSVPQSKRYLDQLSQERGVLVKPRLALGWLALRTTRLPFLTATFVPVFLGLAIAARHGTFDWLTALLTVIGASFAHLAINVTNDIFDERSGADAANPNPTQFSGGSRVVYYGLVSMRQLSLIAVALYAAAVVIGLVLLWLRPSLALLVIGIAGVVVGYSYTGPPLKLVYRGFGEIAVAVGFGPIMLLGAYAVQTGTVALEPFLASLPVAILIALILYVNEVPDRPGDAATGKRTLPVRWSKEAVVRGYEAAVVVTFGLIVVFAVTDLIVRPTLIALLAAPLALPVLRALRESYDQPYALMPAMGKNIQLHLVTGLLLIVGYVIAIIADAALDDPPFFLH
jgi:1,4-dihydroxy-2-naphthoate polyprenyltransferase